MPIFFADPTKPFQGESMIEMLKRIAPQIADYLKVLESYSPTGPAGTINQYIPGALKDVIEQERQGMTVPQYGAARAQITGDVNRMMSGLASKQAQMGAFNPMSLATAGTGAPLRAAAGALAGLQAKKAELAHQGAQAAGGQLTNLYQYPAEEQKARETAYGRLIDPAMLIEQIYQGRRQVPRLMGSHFGW